MIKRLLWVLAVSAVGVQALAADRDLLPPDQAFRLSARLHKPDEVLVRFAVAPGYYLYRDKLAFSVETSAATLGKANLPRGQVKEDEFFGRVEIYRDEVVIRIPVKAAGGSDRFTLIARSQGCADAGVCYTPQRQQVIVGPGSPERQADAPRGGTVPRWDALGEEAAPKR